jgi:hypothetical protein
VLGTGPVRFEVPELDLGVGIALAAHHPGEGLADHDLAGGQT